MEDIYAGTPIVTESDEHIVPNALGGRRKCRGLIDESTNHRFGTTIDAALSRSLHLIRVLLAANSGDGRPAPVLKGMTTDSGDKFNLRPGGLPEVAAPHVRFEERNGQVNITGHARSEGELRRLVVRKLASYGKKFDDVKSMTKAVRSHAPRLAKDITLDPEAWRSIAKMACNLLAAERCQDFLTKSFDAVRRFVNSGEGDVWDFVALNTDPVDLRTASPIGELDHLVVVRGDSATGQVTALVALYEHLQVIVRLGEMHVARSFAHAYRVNQLASLDRRDSEEDLKLVVPPFSRLCDEGQSAWFARMQAAMSAIFDVAMAKSRDAAVRDMIERTVEEVLGKPGGRIITPEEIKILSRLVAERYADMLQHLGAFRHVEGDHGTRDGAESVAEDDPGQERSRSED